MRYSLNIKTKKFRRVQYGKQFCLALRMAYEFWERWPCLQVWLGKGHFVMGLDPHIFFNIFTCLFVGTSFFKQLIETSLFYNSQCYSYLETKLFSFYIMDVQTIQRFNTLTYFLFRYFSPKSLINVLLSNMIFLGRSGEQFHINLMGKQYRM